MKGPVKDARQN